MIDYLKKYETPEGNLKGKKIEEVVFPRKCAGIEIGGNSQETVLVSFEVGTHDQPNPTLPFSPGEPGSSCNKWWLPGLQYLCSLTTLPPKFFVIRDGETVTYMGKQFDVKVDGLGYARLLVDRKKVTRKIRESRTVQGRRLSN